MEATKERRSGDQESGHNRSDNQRLNFETIHKTINTKFCDLSQNLTGNKTQTAMINMINLRIFI